MCGLPTAFFAALRGHWCYKYKVTDWQTFLWDMRYLLDRLRKLHGIFGANLMGHEPVERNDCIVSQLPDFAMSFGDSGRSRTPNSAKFLVSSAAARCLGLPHSHHESGSDRHTEALLTKTL
jgi:hypothetical protein